MTLEEKIPDGVKTIELHFVDLHGDLKAPRMSKVHVLDHVKGKKPIMFDGSSIAGFMPIQDSDMVLEPDPETYLTLPWDNGVGRIICDVLTTDGQPFEGDPRRILKRNLEAAKKQGYTYHVGPELEFFLLKQAEHPELVDRGAYFDPVTSDLGAEVRQKMADALEQAGFTIEMQHHEVAPSQHEVDFQYAEALTTADRVVTFKYILKEIAKREGLRVSFMPKPFSGENGSGMHVHQSLKAEKENAFSDERVMHQFIEGLLQHVAAFSAVTSPTVNSYKRLVPGYEAPVYIGWANKNRSALIRVPYTSPEAARCELRCPDPSANPYLAFSAMLRAGLSGIEQGVECRPPIEENLYALSRDERLRREIEALPSSLRRAVENFERSDLMRETFGPHAFGKYLEAKLKEVDEYAVQVTPWEIERYQNL